MACCVTCHRHVLVALTDRGRLLPVQPRTNPTGRLAVYRDTTPGLHRVRYLHAAEGPLRRGERRVIAHWDVSPACKPARKQGGKEENAA